MYNTGRIRDIIADLSEIRSDIKSISTKEKLKYLCRYLDCSVYEFDELISSNPQVLRTVKGHAFEQYFDCLMEENGYFSEEIGGDSAIDRLVNRNSLQLKTPNKEGTRGTIVQYKTHKTHGAKSEKESTEYYHSLSDFADYLVGLISYDPLNIILLKKSELPVLKNDKTKICSTFTLNWINHLGLNNFDRIGVRINSNVQLLKTNSELLPKSCKLMNLNSKIIIDTILCAKNFRIWDLSIRGFAREQKFQSLLKNKGIQHHDSVTITQSRNEKADGAINLNGQIELYQLKGISTKNCNFNLMDPIIATETQLTRGRVNDHPTQSRLYLTTDFSLLVLAIDPAISKLIKLKAGLQWTFFVIPGRCLKPHHKFENRFASLQKFHLSELNRFLLQ